ncbi:MAG: response regulator [Rhizomicrobium sp.]|nr:response regulator [Rhizomicrobium sp.]
MRDESASPDFLAGGGEMGARMRAHDWSKTALGAPQSWPQSLRTTIRILLTSRYQMWMGWGPDLTFFYNDAYRPTLGEKHNFALGAPASEVWKEIWSDIGPRIAHVLQSGEATWDEGLLLLLERNGYREETYHTFSYSPLADDDGKIVGWLCVVTEETDRVIGERRLSSLRLLASEIAGKNVPAQVIAAAQRSLQSNPRDLPFTLIYLFDKDGVARLACATGVAAGHPIAPSVIAQGDDAVWPIDRILAERKTVFLRDLARFEALPTGAWEGPAREIVIAPIARQGQDTLAGFLVAGINPHRRLDEPYLGFITLAAGQIASGLSNATAYEEERSRAEALAEIDRAKTTFFSNTSHEFRTPLTLMLGPLEDMLARRQASAPVLAQDDELEVMHRNGLRLLKLVNSLLEFSRIEAGRVQARYVPLDLAEYTVGLASTFRSAMDKAGLQFTVDCPPLPEAVYVDRDMWEKIVLNLLSNAFKYTLNGGITVTLRQTPDCSHVELAVSDTGVGIPAQELPRLFERFHRIAGQHGRTQEGTGIGLALVHELVRLQGGAVAAQSTLGSGTTFFVTIPFGREHLPAHQIEAETSPPNASSTAEAFVGEALRWLPDVEADLAIETGRVPIKAGAAATILLADDNADMRNYVRGLLAGHYEVQIAEDGLVAWEMAREKRPDLILSDIMMPRLDGFGLLRALRSDAELRDIPVILLSARAGEEASIEGLEAGADDYLVKPFNARELLARIRANLDMAALRREALSKEAQLRREAQEAQEALRQLNETLEAQVEQRTQEVQNKEARLRSIFETSFIYQGLMALDGTLFDANTTSLEGIGKTLDEVVGLPFWETPWFADTPGMSEIVRAAIPRVAAGATLRQEIRVKLPVGGWRWFEFMMRPIRDGDGKVVAIVPEAVELTARREAEEALRHAQKMEAIGLLTGGVAHDFNNLLTVIRSSADLLRLRDLPEDRRSRYVNAISETADRAAKLTSQLLAFSRRQPLKALVFDLAQHIESIAEMLKTVLGSNITLKLEMAERPLVVEADLSQLETALVNLTANARDAMEGQGTLVIHLARTQTPPPGVSKVGTYVAIAVKDTGCGIASGNLERIFEPFFTTKAVGRGTGLGLAQVYGFAQQSKGAVTVESEVGLGTTITLHLPVSDKPLSATPEQSAEDQLPPARGCILVVEDNRDVGEFSSQLLRELGYDSVLSANAEEALRKLGENAERYDLIFSDVVMPGRDGVSLAREIRQRWPDKPVILTSGYSQVLSSEGSHGFDLLQKPYSVENLARALRSALANRPAEKTGSGP